MGATPIYDSLSFEDQKVADLYLGQESERASVAERQGMQPKFSYDACLEKISALMKQDGETAKYLRAQYSSAYPMQIPEEIESPFGKSR